MCNSIRIIFIAFIHRIRLCAGAILFSTDFAQIQGAILAVIAINAAFDIGAAGAAGFAVRFIQIAAVGANCLGAVFAVGAAGAFTIGTNILLEAFFTHKSAGTFFHCFHKAAVIRRADMGAIFFYCNAAVILRAGMVTAPAFRHCLPIGATAVGMIARCSFHSILRLTAFAVGQGSGAVTFRAFRCH